MTTTSTITVRVPEGVLRTFAEAAFRRVGVAADDTRNAADTFIEAGLRGIDSQGISRLDRCYLQELESGQVSRTPAWQVLQEAPTTARIDVDGDLGMSVEVHAMDLALRKAGEVGTGFVTVGNNWPFGAA